MDNRLKLIGGMAIAGTIIYLLGTEKGRKLKYKIKSQAKNWVCKNNDSAQRVAPVKNETVQPCFIDKATELIVENRHTIANIAGIVLPILAQKAIGKK
ncbi:MAG: hypothetical protein KBA33_01595 [Cloacibacterium sp.]|nr:hypothetical protein [Cloacibacterium sp.]